MDRTQDLRHTFFAVLPGDYNAAIPLQIVICMMVVKGHGVKEIWGLLAKLSLFTVFVCERAPLSIIVIQYQK